MRLQQKLEPRQEQRLILTPELEQALHILQLPILELKTLIEEELTQNPLLQEYSEETLEESNPEKETKEILELDSKWDEYFQAIRPPERDTQEERKRRDFFENSITKPISLQEYLLQQLDELSLIDLEREIAETIIANIDDDGYLKAKIDEIADLLKTSKEKVKEILSIIQNFDPPGIGAQTLKECLLNQLKSQKKSDPLLNELITNHLDDLGKKRYVKITSHLNILKEELKKKIDLISQLEPKPGRKYSRAEINFVVPDIIVRNIDGEYKIIANERELPHLRITPLYKKLLKNTRKTDKISEYIKEKLNGAMWLLKNIQHRQDTIGRVTFYIMKKQEDFLKKGAGHLKVLTLKEVADALGLHSSTVSRTISNKYIETPRGIFKLKYFFSGGLSKQGTFEADKITSSKNVKNLIGNLIKQEVQSSPLSDQQIANLLNKQGYQIARRTVAKYREQLKILPSKMRRSL